MNIVQSLGEYVKSVMDRNKDGQVNFKDLLDLFPNHAVAIAFVFINLLVLASEYRVWDVGLQITKDQLKAIGFVLLSAVPFVLGEIFWLYPVANGLQKLIAVSMVLCSLYTSWVFGAADLSKSYDVDALISMVVNLTVAYIVVSFVYVYSDDGIKAHRMKKQAEGAARHEKEIQKITRDILRELAETQKLQNETVKEFGDAALVQSQVDRLRGTKQKQPTPPAFQPARQFGAESVELPKDEAGQNAP